MCEYRSSSPVILPSDTSATRSLAPLITRAGVMSRLLIVVASVARSRSSLSASGFVPAVPPFTHIRYSSRCQPVHSGSAGLA